MSDELKKTIEELKKEIVKLKATIQERDTTISSLKTNAEATKIVTDKLREGSDESTKKIAALNTVLKKHNISFDISKADLKDLTIVDGNIQGDFSYEPPDPSKNNTRDKGTGGNSGGITMADIQAMSPSQINENWDEVSKVLAANQ